MSFLNAAWADERDKHQLYQNVYRFLLDKDAKTYANVSRETMYREVLDFFAATPWLFYTALSLETYRYLQDLEEGKIQPMGRSDPRQTQDDFALIERFFFADPDRGLNADFLPLLKKMEGEDQPKITQAMVTVAYLKGLLDCYGFIDSSSLIEKANASLSQKITTKELRLYCGLLPIACFYDYGRKGILRHSLQADQKKFLALREKFPGLPYANYPAEEVIAFANRFYFPAQKNDAQRVYGQTADPRRLFSKEEAPFKSLFENEQGNPLSRAYAEVNDNIPKWYLSGHTRHEIEALQAKASRQIVRLEEKDIGPEIFFPFKDTIVGVYNLAKETLGLAGDVATGDMPWGDLEKIKAEFYAHREDYLARYILSLRRNLTPYEQATVDGLRLAIRSQFIFHALSREGATLVDVSDGKRYLVHPLGMGFSEMLEGGVYDEIVSTTIVPFLDYLTYDSFISRSRLLAQLPNEEMLEEGRLIRSSKDFVALA